MASLTQMVVGKGIPNSLIVEGLLKILKNLIPLSPPKSLTNSCHGMVRPQQGCNYFSSEIFTNQTCQVNIIPLVYPTVKLTLYL